MKKVSLLAVISIGGIIGWAMHSKAGPSEMIQIDKGQVLLRLGQKGEATKIRVIPSEGCLAQVAIKRESGKIIAQHDNKPCSTGSRFEISADFAKPTRLLLKAGVVELNEGEKIFSILRQFTASVKAGLIESDSAKVQVQRSADYAGASAQYQNSKGAEGASLELVVDAGTIKW